ncbi:MAG TPA: MBL fold metallo-hydrolase [Candidatus Rifleibacterium sp.]|nr:MBL fold metallo-hydrolase [Candidatus Rifleibacterium sp.]HPT46972.1 MBL fold metallo-hydrolase [Candidatus Rifleibacterium sp.]
MKISFHGAVGCVTGSNYLIETSECRFLVDCGMFQGNKTLRENNYGQFAYDPASIDFVLVTHAHIDHSGLLPKLVKQGFDGPIYATEPTVDLLKHLLPDSAHIQEVEVMQKNRRNERKGQPPLEPIYTEEDAQKAISMLKGLKNYTTFSPAKGCQVTYHNAGHVLGSAFIELELEDAGQKRKFVFSGDLGEDDHPIINDPDRFKSTDFLVVESTYGNRNRDAVSKEDRYARLAEVFAAAEKRGGKIIIPAFALERTQDMLHDILILKERGAISRIPIVVDSPLAKEITQVFVKYPEFYDEDARNVLKKMGNLFDHPDFRFTSGVDESKALNAENNIAIMSASGMCDAGRIKHHLKHNLWNPANTIVFVGYQAEGTLGRLLIEGEKTVRIHGEEITVNAKIEQIYGYSGHADQNGLLNWLSEVEEVRRQVFVVHGEPEAAEEFARLLKQLRNFNAIAPAMNEEFDLLTIGLAAPAKAAEAQKTTAAQKPQALAPQKTPASRPAKVPALDSYNLYADLMIKLAEFMRSSKNEEERRIKISGLLAKL